MMIGERYVDDVRARVVLEAGTGSICPPVVGSVPCTPVGHARPLVTYRRTATMAAFNASQQQTMVMPRSSVRNRTFSVVLLRRDVRAVYANLVNCDCLVSCVVCPSGRNLGEVICLPGESCNDRAAECGAKCARPVWPSRIQNLRSPYGNRRPRRSHCLRRPEIRRDPLAVQRGLFGRSLPRVESAMPRSRRTSAQSANTAETARGSLSGLRLHKIVCCNGAVRLLSNELHPLFAGPDVALAVRAYHLRCHADVGGECPLLTFCLVEPIGKLHASFYGTAIIIAQQ